jgi:DnaJ-domain-containing protein 1
MDEENKIEQLEGEIIELEYQLKKSKDKEMIYLDILSNIDNSLRILFKREQENERFNLGDDVNYRECIVNLKESLDEYKRIYKLRL